jgi:hypothetical protein
LTFTQIGQSFSRDVTSKVADMQIKSYADEIVSMGEYQEPIPVATLYGILTRNEEAVDAVVGYVYGVNVTKADDLTSLFSKKVRVGITELSNDKFQIRVEEE